MFNQGQTQPNDRAKLLLRAISKIINQLPNRISIYGHTSASAGGAKPESDWQLSAGRADASRRVLQSAGVDPDRVYRAARRWWARLHREESPHVPI